jgi:acetolactate synthase-1/2/3 large subunit
VLSSRTPQPAVGEREPAAPPEPPEEAVGRAVDLLSEADSPVILAGGGVRRAGASESLRAVAERLDAPVVTTYKGKGTIPERHPLSAGVLCGGSSVELRDLLADADRGLVVGSDLDAVATASWSAPTPDRLVHVTLDGDDVGFGYETDLGVVADADRFLRALDERRPADASPARPGAERARAVRAADRERFAALATGSDASDDDPPLRSVEVLSAVRDAVPEEAVVTAAAGGFRLWTLVSFPASGPRSYVNPGSWATMGTGLPSAIGAKLANPERDVVALTGDGGLMMCVHELHTAVAAELPITVVVFNNSDYAIISEAAGREFELPEGAYSWADAQLDFRAIAEGMGLDTHRAERPGEIHDALDDARGSARPTLIEVPTDPTEPQASTWMSED